MPQTEILDRTAFGNPGDFFDSSDIRALSYILESGDPLNNVFGRAFSHIAGAANEGKVEAGGTGVFCGYLVNNKEHVLEGSVTGALEPRNYLRNGQLASFCNFGVIYAELPAAANVGDIIIYSQTDGTLSSIAPGVPVPGGSQFGNAVVERFYPQEQNPLNTLYLAAIRITTTPERP